MQQRSMPRDSRKSPKTKIARFRHLTLPKPCNLKYIIDREIDSPSTSAGELAARAFTA
jgi:hypothetical protein